jgi:6-phosphogluconolactonase
MVDLSVHVFSDHDALSRHAAELLLRQAGQAVKARGRFLWALSGGGTPERLYRMLAEPPFSKAMPWSACHLFWGDERLVPPSAAGSNFGQVEATLLDRVPVPASQVHRIRGELAPEEAVADYARHLSANASAGRPWPRFDLALMGLGSDGHTASLFPGPPGLEEQRQPTLAVTGEYAGRPTRRVTLTPAVFNDSRLLLFLVTGAAKAEAVSRVLEAAPDSRSPLPAARLWPTAGAITWLLDEAAAAALSGHDFARHG